jgi:hypothetical protein
VPRAVSWRTRLPFVTAASLIIAAAIVTGMVRGAPAGRGRIRTATLVAVLPPEVPPTEDWEPLPAVTRPPDPRAAAAPPTPTPTPPRTARAGGSSRGASAILSLPARGRPAPR